MWLFPVVPPRETACAFFDVVVRRFSSNRIMEDNQRAAQAQREYYEFAATASEKLCSVITSIKDIN